jgi:hypothetical protein
LNEYRRDGGVDPGDQGARALAARSADDDPAGLDGFVGGFGTGSVAFVRVRE